METSIIRAPWMKDERDIFDVLESSPNGLSSTEATRRAETGPTNVISAECPPTAFAILARQFKSPLVLILIAASAVSLYLGEGTQTAIILLLVLVGGILGFVQEHRSEAALRRLRKKFSRKATVIRDGKPKTVPAESLVLGDIVELAFGSVVPADLRILRAEDLEMDESLLTGESLPVPKGIAPIPRESALPQDLANMAFAGTHVVSGTGTGVVVAVGADTEAGKIGTLLSVRTEETAFQKGIRQFGNFLLILTLVIAALLTVILGVIHGTWTDALLFSLALAVGISPELLPVIVTVNLSRGADAMSRKLVLVKRLSAIEDLGNVDVFCTDKTGTLTVGKLRVRGSVDSDGASSDRPLSYALHCLQNGPNGRPGNPIDGAISDALRMRNVAPAVARASVIDSIPFEFERRRMSCVIGHHGSADRTMIVKGAVSEVLAACTTHSTAHDSRSLTSEARDRIRRDAERSEEEGHRLVAVATRAIGVKERYAASDERDLELVGFIRLSDAPKLTAKPALESLAALNTRVLVLTGDTERATRHVAEQIGFDIRGIMTGDELERMDDSALAAAVTRTNVFARITPAHKLRIIQALKQAGHRVGFMGDGVNDAPALRAADVGISFESAADVAKEAASVILLKKKLSVLADGVREGRRTFVNTRTYVYATMSSNFGNVISLVGASLLLPFIPLLPAQILLLNLLSDAPLLSISTDRVSDDELKQPKKWEIPRISHFMYFFGAISSAIDYSAFLFLFFVVHADVAVFQSGWFVVSLLTEIVVIFLLRSRRLSAAEAPSAPLVVSSVGVVALTFALLWTGAGRSFGLVPLPPNILLMVVAFLAGYIVLVELGKAMYYRFHPERTA